jgi:hypothetical protein
VISVITITGIGDHLQPVWLITFTGMRRSFTGLRIKRWFSASLPLRLPPLWVESAVRLAASE